MIYQHIKTVSIKSLCDDGQHYTADTIRHALERRISPGKHKQNAWYEIGGVSNPSKHQGMILGKTDHQFNFSVNSELFAVTIPIKILRLSNMCPLYVKR